MSEEEVLIVSESVIEFRWKTCADVLWVKLSAIEDTNTVRRMPEALLRAENYYSSTESRYCFCKQRDIPVGQPIMLVHYLIKAGRFTWVDLFWPQCHTCMPMF